MFKILKFFKNKKEQETENNSKEHNIKFKTFESVNSYEDKQRKKKLESLTREVIQVMTVEEFESYIKEYERIFISGLNERDKQIFKSKPELINGIYIHAKINGELSKINFKELVYHLSKLDKVKIILPATKVEISININNSIKTNKEYRRTLKELRKLQKESDGSCKIECILINEKRDFLEFMKDLDGLVPNEQKIEAYKILYGFY